MNTIYLIKMAETNLYKIGFTSNWENRKKSYTTDNPLYECVECLKTQKKSKHWVERMCQQEVKEIGGVFQTKDGTKTEWFKFEGEFSFSMLKCCKNRKIYELN